MAKIFYRGKKIEFSEDVDGHVLRAIKRGRFYEKGMLDFISSLNVKDLIVDVGGNIGNHSIYFASFTNCKMVHTFEPVPQLYRVLLKNIAMNKLGKKITPKNIAIGRKRGFCTVGKVIQGNSSIVKGGGKTRMDTLDSLLGNQKISLIKMDVEGYEPNVLAGAKKIISSQNPYLFIEAHTQKDKKKIDDILLPLGYRAVKVFNPSATYFYAKASSYPTNILSDIALSIRRIRLFRW